MIHNFSQLKVKKVVMAALLVSCQRYYDVIGKNENPVRDDISVEE